MRFGTAGAVPSRPGAAGARRDGKACVFMDIGADRQNATFSLNSFSPRLLLAPQYESAIIS